MFVVFRISTISFSMGAKSLIRVSISAMLPMSVEIVGLVVFGWADVVLFLTHAEVVLSFSSWPTFCFRVGKVLCVNVGGAGLIFGAVGLSFG